MSIDYAKLTVNDIKNMLVQEGRYETDELEQLNIKGKKAWVSLHKDEYEEEGIEIEVNEEDWEDFTKDLGDIVTKVYNDTPEIEQYDRPGYNDPEWNDWVMSQFEPDELMDGKYPNVNALRRLVGKLLGDIVFSGPIDVKTTLSENIGKSVVSYQITIDWKLDDYYATQDIDLERGYPQRTFVATASAWEGSLDGVFSVFPEAMADTRAEVRALRRALRINTVGAEELTKKDVAAFLEKKRSEQSSQGEWEAESLITDQQINTITIMCDRLGIDLQKFINSGSKNYNDISQVTRSAAAGMLKQLNRYQSTGGDSIEIPQDLIGD